MSTDATLPDSAPPAGWSWRLKSWRNDLLCSPRFQRWIARIPLARPVVRRRARAVFDLCAGFVYSQVLLACVRLRLLERVRARPLTQPELERLLDLDAEAAAALLTAAAALGLLEFHPPGAWGLGPVGAALLGNPAILPMIEHHALLYADLGDPVALLRRRGAAAGVAGYWAYASRQQAGALAARDIHPYTRLMSSTQPLVADEVLAAYPVARHRCLLDVGGGEGLFLEAVAARTPQLQLMLFDLPAVAATAQRRLDACGLAGRTRVLGGDFLRDPLPAGADLVSFIRVLHDHDDDTVRALLHKARACLEPGGRVLIGEPMAAVRGSLPGMEAYFAFYLLAMGQGRPRCVVELTRMLAEAGFSDVRQHRTDKPWQCAVLSAASR